MTTLFHLSDLHFGPKFNQELAERILEDIQTGRPDLTIISGDFTMRGRTTEYEQARAYVERLPKPVFAIPGNHDQPLHWGGLPERLTRPWARYQKYIHSTTDAVYQSAELFVVGLNDNHPILPGGLWSTSQRVWLREQLTRAPASAYKILVMHHQLHWNGKLRPFGHWFPTRSLNWLAGLGVELILNGHTHIPITVQTPQGIIIAQSGTSMSTRVRHGHGNTYNHIEIGPASVRVRIMGFDERADRFVPRTEASFPRALHIQEVSA